MKVNQHLFYFLSCKCLWLTALGVRRGRRMKLSSEDILYKTQQLEMRSHVQHAQFEYFEEHCETILV